MVSSAVLIHGFDILLINFRSSFCASEACEASLSLNWVVVFDGVDGL